MIRTGLLLCVELVKLPRLRSRGHRGRVAEKIANNRFISKDYKLLESKIRGNNGFDGCFVKYEGETIKEICIIETKFTSKGSFSFGKTSIGTQSSREWVWGTLIKMFNSGDSNIRNTAKIVAENISKNIVKIGVFTVTRRQCEYNEMYTLEMPDKSLPHWRGIMEIQGIDTIEEVRKYEPNLTEKAVNLLKSVRNVLLNIDKVISDVRKESELYANVIELQYYFGLSVVECSRFKPHIDDLGDSIIIRGNERKCYIDMVSDISKRYVRVGTIKQRQILDELKETIEEECSIKPLTMSLETFKDEFNTILFKNGISNIDRYFEDNKEVVRNDDIGLVNIRERLLLKSRRYAYVFDLQTKSGFSLPECAEFRPHTMECNLDTSEMKTFIKEGRALKPNHQSFIQFKAGYITLLQQCGIYDMGKYDIPLRVSLAPSMFSPTRILLNKANPLPFNSIEDFGRSRFTCILGLQLLFDLSFDEAVSVRPYEDDLGSNFRRSMNNENIRIRIIAQRDVLSMASSLVSEGFELKPTSMRDVDFKKKYITTLKENGIDDIDKYLFSNSPVVKEYINNVSYIITDDKIENYIAVLLATKSTIRYGCMLGLQFYFKLTVNQACNVRPLDIDDNYLRVEDTKLKIVGKKSRDVVNAIKDTVSSEYKLRPTSIPERTFIVNYCSLIQKQDMFFLDEYLGISKPLEQLAIESPKGLHIELPKGVYVETHKGACIELPNVGSEITEPVSSNIEIIPDRADAIARQSFSSIMLGKALSIRDTIMANRHLLFDMYLKRLAVKEEPKQIEQPKPVEPQNIPNPEPVPIQKTNQNEYRSQPLILETYNKMFIINGKDIRSGLSDKMLCILGLQVCFDLDFEKCRMMTSKDNDKGDFLMVSDDRYLPIDFPPKRDFVNLLGLRPLQPNSISREAFEKEFYNIIAGGRTTIDNLRRKIAFLVEDYKVAFTPPTDIEYFMKRTIDRMCSESPRLGFLLGVQYYLKLSIVEGTTITIEKGDAYYKNSEQVIKTLPSSHTLVKNLVSSISIRLQPNSLAKDVFIAQYFSYVQNIGIYKYDAYVPSYVPRFVSSSDALSITKPVVREPVRIVYETSLPSNISPNILNEVGSTALTIGKRNKNLETLFKMSIYFDESDLGDISSFCIENDDHGDYIIIGSTKCNVDTVNKRNVLEEVRNRSWKKFPIRKRMSNVTFVALYNETLKECNIPSDYATRNKQALYEACKANTTNKCDISSLPKNIYNLLVLQILFGMSVDECVSFVPSDNYDHLLKRKTPRVDIDPEQFLKELRKTVWKNFPMRLRRSAKAMKVVYLAQLQLKGIVDVDAFIRNYTSGIRM